MRDVIPATKCYVDEWNSEKYLSPSQFCSFINHMMGKWRIVGINVQKSPGLQRVEINLTECLGFDISTNKNEFFPQCYENEFIEFISNMKDGERFINWIKEELEK